MFEIYTRVDWWIPQLANKILYRVTGCVITDFLVIWSETFEVFLVRCMCITPQWKLDVFTLNLGEKNWHISLGKHDAFLKRNSETIFMLNG